VPFAHDLAIGIQAELRLLEHLRQKYPDAYKVEGKHSEYDLVVPGRFTIEVKFDPASQRTGNVVIEYYHGKASGLHVSTADWWVFDTGERDGVIWLTQSAVRQCIVSESLQPVKIQGPDDRLPKWVFLVPLKVLKRYSSQEP